MIFALLAGVACRPCGSPSHSPSLSLTPSFSLINNDKPSKYKYRKQKTSNGACIESLYAAADLFLHINRIIRIRAAAIFINDAVVNSGNYAKSRSIRAVEYSLYSPGGSAPPCS